MSVIKLRRETIERLKKYREEGQSWDSVVSSLLDRIERLPERLPKMHEIESKIQWLTRSIETYGKKWLYLIELVERHHLAYHRAKRIPDDIRELIDKLKEGL